jgi:hypothetical protein
MKHGGKVAPHTPTTGQGIVAFVESCSFFEAETFENDASSAFETRNLKLAR